MRSAEGLRFCQLAASVVEGLPDAVLVVEGDGRIVYQNPPALRLLWEGQPGSSLLACVPSGEQPAFSRALASACVSGPGLLRLPFQSKTDRRIRDLDCRVQPLPQSMAPLLAIVITGLNVGSHRPRARGIEAAVGPEPLAPEPGADRSARLRLERRHPEAYDQAFDRYCGVLEDLFAGVNRRLPPSRRDRALREVAEQLGRLGAGAREVAEMHAGALKRYCVHESPRRGQVLAAEGRLAALELMGHLLTFYRRRGAGPSLP